MKRLVVLLLAWGCTDPEPTGEPAWFPASYRTTYQETHGCRLSLEHRATMKILVAADAVEAYTGRTMPFAPGAIVLKEEFAQRDAGCAGKIERYTVMRKLAAGSSPDTLDWEWQDVGANLHDQGTDIPSCVTCHKVCGKAPMGYDGTCAEKP